MFPVNWAPYPFQEPCWEYLVEGGRTAVCVWHRRSGKDILGVNWITASALHEKGVYWYLFPTEDQAKKTIFKGQTLDGRSYLDFIPKEYVKTILRGAMEIELINGSIIQFSGASNPKALRGAGIKGCVFSEYSFMNIDAIESVIQPMLVRSKGWALYLYTPSDNPYDTHGETLYEEAKNDPDSFADCQTIDDTTDHDGKPLLTEKDMAVLKARNYTEEKIQREFYCNFEAHKYASKDDGTFIDEMQKAEAENRLTIVPYDSAYKVDTYWDVGLVDYTVIWFVQNTDKGVAVIDLYTNRQKPIPFYLEELSRRPYTYGRMVLPPDMLRRNLMTLDTRLTEANEAAEKLKLPQFLIVSQYKREVMIEKAKALLTKCLIDSKRCEEGIYALYEYDEKERKPKSKFHDDIVDAFLYLAVDLFEQEKMADNRSFFEKNYRPMKTLSDYDEFGFGDD